MGCRPVSLDEHLCRKRAYALVDLGHRRGPSAVGGLLHQSSVDARSHCFPDMFPRQPFAAGEVYRVQRVPLL